MAFVGVRKIVWVISYIFETNVEAIQALFGLETYSLELRIWNCANIHWTQGHQSGDLQALAAGKHSGDWWHSQSENL